MHHSLTHLNEIYTQAKKKTAHKVIMVSSVVYPLTTIPQIYEIYKNQSVENISLLTYGFYAIFTLIFLSYGIQEKLKPIIVLQSLWLIMYGIIVTQILTYR